MQAIEILPDEPTEFEGHDYLTLLLHNFNYDAQLKAIQALLGQYEKTALHLQSAMQKSHDDGDIDAFGEQFYDEIYQSIAHSMSAIGMLAPFIESFFCQVFQGIHNDFSKPNSLAYSHPRLKQLTKKSWNCRFFWKEGKYQSSLIEGIIQLAKAIKMFPYLPQTMEQTLQAIFCYRNNMFHWGFEWPQKERISFEKRIIQSDWQQDWFPKATSDNEPWIFSLSQKFIEHCINMINMLLEGMRNFIGKELL